MTKDSLADNEFFVALISAAKNDSGLKLQLLTILQQPAFHRKSLLNTLMTDMSLQSAPADFIKAINALTDDAIADRALELLKNE